MSRAAHRRPGAGFGRRGGGRVGGGGAPETALGVQLVATQYLLSGGTPSGNPVCLLVRWRPDATPANSLGTGGGTSSLGGGASGGGSIIVNNAGLGSVGNEIGFANTATDGKIHIPVPGESGRMVNDVLVRDTIGNKDHHSRDGREFGIGASAGSGTSFTTGKFCINGRPSAPTTFQFGSMTFVEAQLGTTALSAAQIAALVASPVGTQMPGCIHQWVASDLSGGVIADRVTPNATNNLTLTGAASLVPVLVKRAGRGSIELFWDSIGAGKRPDTTLGNGPRKELQRLLVAAGYSCALVGQYVPGASCTADFDARCTCLSSQALGLVVGAVPSRLSTLAADVLINGGPDCGSFCGYGANDVFQRITNGETPTQCRDHFLADWDTFCSTVRAVRTGRIVFGTVLRQGTSASTADMRTAIDLINAAASATVATLNATYGDVRLADVCTAATPDQAAADDLGVLYDRIHPTDPTDLLIAAPIAAAFAA